MNLKSLGWVVVFALAAVFVGGGFDNAGNKMGVVDIAKVFNDSDYAAKQDELLHAFGDARSAILDFLNQYPVATADQATQLRDLYLKNPLSEADQKTLDSLKKSIQAEDASYKALLTKPNPAPTEVAQLNTFGARVQATNQLLSQWSAKFTDDVNDYKDKLRAATMTRVQTAIKTAGAKGSYTIVFSTDAAPFGANDMTADALKAMNAEK
jgi:Skp family chaperone for outer membrane proteins